MALGPKEMLLIGAGLLILFGPARLPELGAALGKGVREFRKASREFTDAATEETPPDKK